MSLVGIVPFAALERPLALIQRRKVRIPVDLSLDRCQVDPVGNRQKPSVYLATTDDGSLSSASLLGSFPRAADLAIDDAPYQRTEAVALPSWNDGDYYLVAVTDVFNNVYERMKTERERLAKKNRAEGQENARRIRAEAEKEARIIVANATRDAEITKGEGDAEATRIYAEAYGTDPDFYEFTRSLEAYRKTIGADTTLVLSPESEFFQFFERSEVNGAR